MYKRSRPLLFAAIASASLALVAACSSGGSSSSAGSPTSSAARPGVKGDESSAAGDGAGNVYTPTGPLVADSGFRPDVNGFPFPNYGNDAMPQNLGPEEMRQLFGDSVCANTAGGTCDLIPPAQEWMDTQNKGMGGGHCYGMSVSALLTFRGVLKPDTFGGPAVPQLTLDNNKALQSRIALDFVKQGVQSVKELEIHGTPNELLDKLIEAYKAGNSEPNVYGIGIYKTDLATGAVSGGHEVTPYAVEDHGDGKFAVLIYDNNYPKVTHAIIFDRNANTWNYTTTTVPGQPPDAYIGDANTKTLTLDRVPTDFGPQPCPFCAKDPGASGGSAALHSRVGGRNVLLAASGAQQYNEFTLDGPVGSFTNHPHLLFTDPAGHHYGYLDGKWVTEIPGIKSEAGKLDDSNESVEPVYSVPDNLAVTVTIDGSGLSGPSMSSLSMVGPGIDLAIDDINVQPGEKDVFTPAPDGSRIRYKSDRSEAPTLALGAVDANADYGFAVKGLELQPGEEIDLQLGPDTLKIDASNAKSSGTYALAMVREDSQSQQQFSHEGIALDPGEKATLQFGKFAHNGDSIPLVINRNGTEETQLLTDSK